MDVSETLMDASSQHVAIHGDILIRSLMTLYTRGNPTRSTIIIHLMPNLSSNIMGWLHVLINHTMPTRRPSGWGGDPHTSWESAYTDCHETYFHIWSNIVSCMKRANLDCFAWPSHVQESAVHVWWAHNLVGIALCWGKRWNPRTTKPVDYFRSWWRISAHYFTCWIWVGQCIGRSRSH